MKATFFAILALSVISSLAPAQEAAPKNELSTEAAQFLKDMESSFRSTFPANLQSRNTGAKLQIKYDFEMNKQVLLKQSNAFDIASMVVFEMIYSGKAGSTVKDEDYAVMISYDKTKKQAATTIFGTETYKTKGVEDKLLYLTKDKEVVQQIIEAAKKKSVVVSECQENEFLVLRTTRSAFIAADCMAEVAATP